MNYTIKWFEETVWAVLHAVVGYVVGVAALGFPADNWKPWVLGVAVGVVRVVGATIGNRLPNTPSSPTSNDANSASPGV